MKIETQLRTQQVITYLAIKSGKRAEIINNMKVKSQVDKASCRFTFDIDKNDCFACPSLFNFNTQLNIAENGMLSWYRQVSPSLKVHLPVHFKKLLYFTRVKCPGLKGITKLKPLGGWMLEPVNSSLDNCAAEFVRKASWLGGSEFSHSRMLMSVIGHFRAVMDPHIKKDNPYSVAGKYASGCMEWASGTKSISWLGNIKARIPPDSVSAGHSLTFFPDEDSARSVATLVIEPPQGRVEACLNNPKNLIIGLAVFGDWNVQYLAKYIPGGWNGAILISCGPTPMLWLVKDQSGNRYTEKNVQSVLFGLRSLAVRLTMRNLQGLINQGDSYKLPYLFELKPKIGKNKDGDIVYHCSIIPQAMPICMIKYVANQESTKEEPIVSGEFRGKYE